MHFNYSTIKTSNLYLKVTFILLSGSSSNFATGSIILIYKNQNRCQFEFVLNSCKFKTIDFNKEYKSISTTKHSFYFTTIIAKTTIFNKLAEKQTYSRSIQRTGFFIFSYNLIVLANITSQISFVLHFRRLKGYCWYFRELI